MVRQRLVEGDYLRQAIDYSVRLDDGQVLGHDGRYYQYCNRMGVFVPLGTGGYTGQWRELSWFGPAMFNWANRNAEFFRWTLVDESIPLEKGDGKLVFGLFDGCRRSNVMAIELLRYWPALPELREAMLHERDTHLRLLCVEAIGSMGEHGRAYARDVQASVREFKDPWYQGAAVETLGKFGDKTCVPLLLELFEEARARIDALSFDEAMKEQRESMDLIGHITKVLIRLDPAAAREVLAMELASPNPHVRYFVRREFKLSRERHVLSLIESADSGVVSALPTNPRWIFQRTKGIARR